jgi:hypothetical protein
MIVSPALMMMLLAAQGGDPVGVARQGYAKCLGTYMSEALDKKITVEEFKSTLQPKCAEKETAFRDAVKTADRSYGMSDKEATQDAADQVKDYLDNFATDYADYLQSGAKPG